MAKPKHSRLGASSAKRWMTCSGSVALVAMVPPAPETSYAAEGTAAHMLAEKVLTETPAAEYYRLNKTKFYNHAVTEEMARGAQLYADKVKEIQRETKGTLLIEHKIHLSTIHPDLYGTCDAIVYQDFGALHVFDYKYGAGIPVEVEENEQIMYYALGALALGDFDEVHLHICQPRAEHSDGPFRSWSTTPARLIEFGKELRARALATQKKDAPLKAGEHCRFCPAAAVCPELHRNAVEVAQTDFAEPKLPAVQKLTHLQIAKVVEHRKLIENWFSEVETYALNALQRGEHIEGIKLVRGRSRREWKDDGLAAQALRSKLGPNAYRRKLLSVSEAEKALGKDFVSGLSETLDGRVTVAHQSDRRKALPSAAESARDDFKIEFDENDF